MTKDKPLLSICIPTYNRAELLQSALLSIVPQVNEHGDEVELIVSDNCSTDNTKEIVEWARQYGPITYHKNETNIGACRNIINLSNELAKGEFCWTLGDDDFLRPGGLTKVLDILKLYPEVDYIYVNIAHIFIDQLKDYAQPISSGVLPEDLPLGNKDRSERYIERWESLIHPDISGVFLGGIQVSVYRRSIWNKYSATLSIGEPMSSLDSTYPHVKIFAQGLVGKKAYYIGTPWVIVVNGAREWWNIVPMIVLVRLNDVLDFYEKSGVNRQQIRLCRAHILAQSGPIIWRMILYPDMPGRKHVSILRIFWKYWSHITLWRSLFYSLRERNWELSENHGKLPDK